MTAAFAVLTFKNIDRTLVDYFSYPTSTYNLIEAGDLVKFPSVTVCSLNRHDGAKIVRTL